jgi:ligand-binding sensor domain-containing protein
MFKFQTALLLFVSFILFSCQDEDSLIFKKQPYHIANVDLMDYRTTCIGFDKKNNTWVGTTGKGLVKYNPVGWRAYNSKNSLLPNDTVNDVFVDKANNVWVATNNGVVKIPPAGTWVVYSKANSQIPYSKVTKISAKSSGQVWLSSGDARIQGLCSFDGTVWKEMNSSNSRFPAGIVNNLVTDKNDVLWFSVDSNLVKCENDVFTVFNGSNSPLNSGIIDDIVVTPNNNLYISINHQDDPEPDLASPGLIRFDGTVFEINNPSIKGKTYAGFVKSIAVDASGNIWTSTVGQQSLGLFHGGEWYINKTDFGHAVISDIAIDSHDRIWLATNNGILVLLD